MGSLTFKPEVEKALNEGDLGEDMGGGVYFKTLPTKVPRLNPEDIATAKTVRGVKPRTRAERQRIPYELATKAMQYYIENLNNGTILNPIRDGIPQCRLHPFKSGEKYGCVEGCTGGNLPVARDYTLGDVFEWLKGMISFNFRRWEKKNPAFKGYVNSVV